MGESPVRPPAPASTLDYLGRGCKTKVCLDLQRLVGVRTVLSVDWGIPNGGAPETSEVPGPGRCGDRARQSRECAGRARCSAPGIPAVDRSLSCLSHPTAVGFAQRRPRVYRRK